jgi:hypothetical protein
MPPSAPAANFEHGRELIQANCVDCMGGNRAGLEEGIKEIEQPIKAGSVQKKEGYQLLLDRYANLLTYSENAPAAHRFMRSGG